MTEISKPQAYKALSLAVLALVINFWAWTLLSPLGIRIANELHLSTSQLSFVLALPIIFGALGRIPLGILADRYGGRIILTLTSLLTAGAVAHLTFADSYYQMLLAAILLGIGGASFSVGVPFVSAWFSSKQRGLMLGIYSMGNVGTALSALVTPTLSDNIGKLQTFWLVAFCLVALAVIFWVCAKDSPAWRPASLSARRSFGLAVNQRLTWDMSIVYALSFGAFVAFGVYLPVILKLSYDLSLTDAAARAGGFVLVATLARPFGGWLSDRIGARKVVKAGLMFVAMLAGFVAFQQSLELHITVAYLSLAFVLGCCNGAVFAIVGKAAKAGSMGSVTGVVGAIGGIGGFLPPLLLGATYQYTHSFGWAYILLSIMSLVVFVYCTFCFRDKKLYAIV